MRFLRFKDDKGDATSVSQILLIFLVSMIVAFPFVALDKAFEKKAGETVRAISRVDKADVELDGADSVSYTDPWGVVVKPGVYPRRIRAVNGSMAVWKMKDGSTVIAPADKPPQK